jgi:hypothetical protein
MPHHAGAALNLPLPSAIRREGQTGGGTYKYSQ